MHVSVYLSSFPPAWGLGSLGINGPLGNLPKLLFLSRPQPSGLPKLQMSLYSFFPLRTVEAKA